MKYTKENIMKKEYIHIRTTKEQKEVIKQRAKQMNLSMSAYVLMVLGMFNFKTKKYKTMPDILSYDITKGELVFKNEKGKNT